MRVVPFLFLVSFLVVAAACSEERFADGGVPADGSGIDGGSTVDGDVNPGRCGDGMVGGAEACDDGNRVDDDGCSGSCEIECGDGRLTGAEVCDPGIPTGDSGACPTSCDDLMACTSDTVSGTGCAVTCVFGEITIPASGDGCCPPSANATNDDDCPATCGNSIVELSETCDTGITTGAGACPTACDDGEVCTTDSLSMAGTCTAACVATPITTAIDGDACCPSGESLLTDSDCAIACGDGVLSTGESCDTAIVGAAGECPLTCPDLDVCTPGVLMNGGTCDALCSSTSITDPINGDGCCPPGATIATDDDCTATCGDGVRTGGETCDTAIPAGLPDACPTTCMDAFACTADTLVGAGTCSASCTFPPITTPMNGDGCCPSGANIGNDNDCPVACGDGVVSGPGETCDTAIALGPGSCPTACDDSMVCTSDTLANPATCQALCVFTPITTPMNGDGCCPAGANECSDNDCAVACGDGCTSASEDCDDGNMMGGDGCSAMCRAEPRAFRAVTLTLIDPRVYAFGFINVTGTVNGLISDAITMDGDMDGFLDFSPLTYFPAFIQDAPTQATELVFAECTPPPGTMCSTTAMTTIVPTTATYTSAGSDCLGPIPGTAPGATIGNINSPGPACFATSGVILPLSLGGVPITLRGARVAATYVGSPASNLATGLLMGFLTDADAMMAIIPPGTTGVGGIDGNPISDLLRSSDRDDFDGDGTDDGWWFYLNFNADVVPYTP